MWGDDHPFIKETVSKISAGYNEFVEWFAKNNEHGVGTFIVKYRKLNSHDYSFDIHYSDNNEQIRNALEPNLRHFLYDVLPGKKIKYSFDMQNVKQTKYWFTAPLYRWLKFIQTGLGKYGYFVAELTPNPVDIETSAFVNYDINFKQKVTYVSHESDYPTELVLKINHVVKYFDDELTKPNGSKQLSLF